MPTTRRLLFALTTSLLAACGGGSGGGGPPGTPPSGLVYPVDPGLYRVGEAIAPNVPGVGGGPVDTYAVQPALPAGLSLDPATGVISGTPTSESATTTHTVTASNAAGSTQATLGIAVGKALPPVFDWLEDGFQAEALFTTPDVVGVVKMARTPDGRILFVEKDTGLLRVHAPQMGLKTAPYMDLSSVLLGAETWTLLTGSHRGLIAVAVHPDFANNGYVYVMLSLENSTFTVQKTVVLRFTDDPVNDEGTNQVLVLDGLPTANTNNGGELLFEPGGTLLYVSVGDTEDATNAQADIDLATPGTLGGKILRIVPDAPATVPPGNASGTFEWVRGVRNCFGLALHPATGGLFGVDTEGTDAGTGLSMRDELNFLVEGKNYGWGAAPGTIPGGQLGFRAWDSPNTTVTPTSLAWHTGPGFSTPTTDTLLMGWYNADAQGHRIRRFTMSGVVRADVDDETDFARLRISASGNEPLDLCIDPVTGDIHLVLMSGVYRIWPIS